MGKSEYTYDSNNNETLYTAYEWNTTRKDWDIKLIGIYYYSPFSSAGVSNQKDDMINIYPNPAGDWIQLAGLYNTARIQIFDLQGCELIFRTIVADETLPNGNLQEGLYSIKITAGNRTFSTKLIKQ